jgi:hypothetical protein
MKEVYTTRFGFETGRVSAEIDTVHASVYRLVTWIAITTRQIWSACPPTSPNR